MKLSSLDSVKVQATIAIAVFLTGACGSPALADVKLPSIFGSHMVLQRGQNNRVWGWAEPGEEVKVAIADQTKATKAGDDGRWTVQLDPLAAGGPHQLTIAGKNTLALDDVLVGEVWLCSGQSNMQFAVSNANDGDLEKLSAKYPQIRLISVPQVGTQEPQDNFVGQWQVCSPDTVGEFSAVGFFFGRQLHQTLGVPVGLIDNSWGGSACEAWVKRDLLAADERYKGLLDQWEQTEKTFDFEKAMADFREKRKDWEARAQQAKDQGKQPPAPPRAPQNVLAGQHRPGNLYCGVLHPIIGYGIRGAIWYQGEANAGRAYQYRDLFPLMIKLWRDEWKQGDFPFYWVQLADYMAESPEPRDSAWAELREAQTMTMAKLPNTGQAVITDLGEAADIHPRNKQDVAKRLARWALAKNYGVEVPCASPLYKSMECKDNKIVVQLEVSPGPEGALDSFDVAEVRGFSIAGEDKKFVPAKARIVGRDHVEVWSDTVSNPVAVRYAWADNPVCNLRSKLGLPVTPFRTDDWPGVTAGK
jgi:sialate O-acetylesterase